MKIEKINENKIKITLTVKDLEDRQLDFTSLKYNSPTTQQLFWEIMKEAEEECGFSASNSQLFIEAAAIKGGNFTLTITKLTANNQLPHLEKTLTKPKELKLKRKDSSVYSKYIYKFTSFDDLCHFASLPRKRKVFSNSLYEMKGSYYLIVNSKTPDLDVSLSDFAMKVDNAKYTEGILLEHGNVIIPKNALNKIEKYFV